MRFGSYDWLVLGRSAPLSRLARRLRVEYPGAVYPMMNRGARSEPIFQYLASPQRLMGGQLRRRGWVERTLGERSKGDRELVTITRRLRQETLVTVAWIAGRLQMGSVANVNTPLDHWRQGRE